MSTAESKIRPVDKGMAEQARTASDIDRDLTDEIKAKSQRDMGKIALFMSILALLVMVVLFFGLNQNISGLSQKVDQVAELPDQVATLSDKVDAVNGATASLDSRVTGIESQMDELEKLPQMARRAVLANILNELSQNAEYLSGRVETPEQAERLRQAAGIIQGIQEEYSR